MSRVVLRVEPQFTREEAPARERGVSVAGLLELDRGGAYEAFTEAEAERLVERLGEARLVVGHRLLGRDYAFLEGYAPGARARLRPRTLDLAADLRRRHGRAPSLSALGEGTLLREQGPRENAALLWRTGRVAELLEQNRQDVLLLRDVYLFGHERGFVLAREPGGSTVELEVAW